MANMLKLQFFNCFSNLLLISFLEIQSFIADWTIGQDFDRSNELIFILDILLTLEHVIVHFSETAIVALITNVLLAFLALRNLQS